MVEQNNFKRFRTRAGFSIMELAAKTGVSTATIVGVEKYNLYPGISVRERLSNVLQISEKEVWPCIESTEVSANGNS